VQFNERIRVPGGFRLPLPPTERVWNTPSGKAEFLRFVGLREDPALADPTVLKLTTLRSHDQYNTTIYGLDDRYRGVFGRRDVLFMNEEDLAERGMEEGDELDVVTAFGQGQERRLARVIAVTYKIAKGSVGAYYPEANCLVPLDYIDKASGTPSYKSVPVRVTRAATA
jgi:anaerobic selenocysteine-containing dehydrogenase